MLVKNQSLIIILAIASALLCVPLVAMQFTSEVHWTASDFAIAAVLLFGTGLLVELAIRKVKKWNVRLFVILGILATLFLVWAELAVGIFGTPFAGN
ncbi:hypothetical protein [Lacihabitans soyangensis]|uniref:Uncharacterized protein n=1 Tax=Lacihabitans soyangensis TaxID=869394 RepID=A0AAE3KSY8_9BACT|nr:hypothetical protein [Lacihabitans soyangensis]MCP9761721.1 hypothetical protein [Lacihabitans soyangensis]